MSGPDGLGPVELFEQHQARQFVREGQGGEAPAIVGPLKQVSGVPLGPADQETDQVDPAQLQPRQMPR